MKYKRYIYVVLPGTQVHAQRAWTKATHKREDASVTTSLNSFI